MTTAQAIVRAGLVIALGLGLVACSDDTPPPSASSQGSSLSSVGSTGSVRSSAPATPAQVQAATAPAAPEPPTGETLPVPASIDSTCGSDVSDALENFLRSVPTNSTVMFAANGCYLVNGTLTLDSYNKATIDGNGATIKATTDGDRDRRHFILSDANDVTIRNLTIVGANPQPGVYDSGRAFQHGFQLTSVHRVVLDHVAVNHVYGDFVYIGGGGGKPSLDVAVTGSTFDGSGRQGVSVTDAARVLIGTNHIANAGRSLIDIEPNATRNEARDIRITDNTTGAAVNFWLANKGAGTNVGTIEIDGNKMEAPTGGLLFAYGPSSGKRGPYAVRDNQFIANNAVSDELSVGAMVFANYHDVTISGNRVTFVNQNVMPAVELRSSQRVTITANDFSGASQPVVADAATTNVAYTP